MQLSPSDYQALAEFRYQLRRFLSFSEQQAREAGIEPQQHQLLLTLKGLPSGDRPTVSELAERLQLRHHSTVELINRAESHGLVERTRDENDRRQVLVGLTREGEAILSQLTLAHRTELQSAGPELIRVLQSLMAGDRPHAPQGAN